MRIMGRIKEWLERESKELNVTNSISLEQARKYEKNKKYQDCFFEPVIEDGVMRFIPHLEKSKIQEKRERPKPVKETKREKSAFIREVTGNGAYQGIGSRKNKQQQTNSYNNWQTAKRYNPEQFVR